MSVVVIAAAWLAGSAVAAPITVQFSGRLTSTTGSPLRPSAIVSGYFTYDPVKPPGLQSADHPILVVEVPEDSLLLELNAYNLSVRDNHSEYPGDPAVDGLLLTFAHPWLESGAGTVFLGSTNVGLFSGQQLPAALPSLERLDRRTVSFFHDGLEQWGAGGRIEELFMVAGEGARRPVLINFTRFEDHVSFRFYTQPQVRYRVEYTEVLPALNWTTLTNLGPTLQLDAIIGDTVIKGKARFYRVRKDPL